MQRGISQEKSIFIVRLLFTAMVVFGGAAVVSANVSGSAVPMILALMLYFIFLLNQLTAVFHGPDSRLKAWLKTSFYRLAEFKYGGAVLGGVVIAIFAVLSLIAFILAQLV